MMRTARVLPDRLEARPTEGAPSPLTPRQQRVLELIWEGLTMKEIAGVLHLSPHYIFNVRCALYRRLTVHSQVQAVRRGLQLGLLTVDHPGDDRD